MTNLGKQSTNTASDTLLFYMEFIYPFTKMSRAGWVKYWDVPESKAESVAAHIFAVQFFALFANQEFDLRLSIEKILSLALAHELLELEMGDIPVRDKISKEEKEALILKARKNLERKLSKYKSGKYFLSLLDEFLDQKSKEAIFVREVDKLVFSMQGASYCKDGIGKTCNGEKLVEYTLPELKTDKLKDVAKLIKSSL